jgi:hypothetical protein
MRLVQTCALKSFEKKVGKAIADKKRNSKKEGIKVVRASRLELGTSWSRTINNRFRTVTTLIRTARDNVRSPAIYALRTNVPHPAHPPNITETKYAPWCLPVI